jgi:hypothetical protein
MGFLCNIHWSNPKRIDPESTRKAERYRNTRLGPWGIVGEIPKHICCVCEGQAFGSMRDRKPDDDGDTR